MAAKEMCIANPIVKSQYQTAENPIFEVFYLENPHGVIADFSETRLTSSKKRAARTGILSIRTERIERSMNHESE